MRKDALALVSKACEEAGYTDGDFPDERATNVIVKGVYAELAATRKAAEGPKPKPKPKAEDTSAGGRAVRPGFKQADTWEGSLSDMKRDGFSVPY